MPPPITAVPGKELEIDTDRIIRLADGRDLGLCSYGARDGQPVLCLHGTPGSRLKFRLSGALAGEFGLRLHCPDRWGYGLYSAPPFEPALSAFAADMRELADALGLARFSVVGISGGGPFAVAVAAELPDRVDRLALIAPVGPLESRESHEPPLGAFHRFTFTALPNIPGAVRLTFSAFRVLLRISPRLAAAVVASRAHSADREVFSDRACALALGEMMRAGLAAGVSGPVIDMRLFNRLWDIDPNAIKAVTRLWIGLDDRNVPIGRARYLAHAIPRATLTEIPGAGHFWIMQNYGEVFEWLRDEPA